MKTKKVIKKENEYLNYLSRLQKAILILLYVDKIPIKGKAWFQKEIFLISKLDKDIQEGMAFKPDTYGPHSYNAEYALESLEEEGLVDVICGKEINLTPEGNEIANKIKKEFSEKDIVVYKEIKDFINDLSKMELLVLTYKTNKEMVTPSYELNKVKTKLLFYATSLYKKNKIGLIKASEIAGVSLKVSNGEIKKEIGKK